MIIINNKEEFEKFYPYKKEHIEEYPKEYPCMCKVQEESIGVMGYEWKVYVAYHMNALDSDISFSREYCEWKLMK